MRHFAIAFSLVVFCVIATIIIGCDDPVVGPMMEPIVDAMDDEESAQEPIIAGEIKQPDEEEQKTPETEEPVKGKSGMVTEIKYYADWNFAKQITGEVYPGDIIYTKVMFSKEVSIVIADDNTARPNISYDVGQRKSQYRMKPRSVENEDLRSGDARAYRDTKNIFICKYILQERDVNKTLTVYVNDDEISGDPLLVTARIEKRMQQEPVPINPFGDLTFFIHGDGASDKPTEYKGTAPNQGDFIGYVLIPKVNREVYPIRTGAVRPFSQPIEGVTVTIVSGNRSGESTTTDQNGQYVFRGIEENELHLLVEKEHFEPKEVIVHRSQPTSLANGITPNYWEDPQRIPGNILIGQAWPDPIRPILQQLSSMSGLVHDLLYIEVDLLEKHGGLYDSAVLAVDSNQTSEWWGAAGAFGAFAHEFAHIYQHATVSLDGSGNLHDWVNTPGGISFAEARQKDWNEVGKAPYDSIPGYDTLIENSAETIAHYWSVDRWGGRTAYGKLETEAPNRFKWAQEAFGRNPNTSN